LDAFELSCITSHALGVLGVNQNSVILSEDTTMFNEPLPYDLERQSGPIEGRDFYINRDNVTIQSDISQGLTTALEMAVDEEVYLSQINLECLEQLNKQVEDVDAKSDDTIDPDEELPPSKPLPPLRQDSSVSSLTNDLSRAVPNSSNFLVARMIDDNYSSFDERYTYHHPPFAGATGSVTETGWPSVASTRTPTQNKVALSIDMNPGQTRREIGSVGYLNELTRGPDLDGNAADSLSGKNSSSRCSVGFIAYLRDRYAHTSRKNQVLILIWIIVLLMLLVVSCAIGVVEARGRGSGQSIGLSELAQPSSSSNADLENDNNLPETPANEPIMFEELAVDYVGSSSTATTIAATVATPTASADAILQDQFRDHEGIFNNDGLTSKPAVSPTRQPAFAQRKPTPTPSTLPTLAPA
jgi:hypothetical protein